MKYTFLLIMMFILNLNVDAKKEGKETKINNEITIKIVDEKTNELLVGVKNDNTYSDFDGNLKINKNKEINLELISYRKLNIESIKNDTIIKMKMIE